MNNLTDIKSMTLDELTEFVTENGFPKFRAKQIYDWLYKNVTDFDNMRNIPADLKAFLKSSSYISVATGACVPPEVSLFTPGTAEKEEVPW